MSKHIVAEFSGIERRKLEDVAIVEAIMNKVVSEAQLKVVGEISYQFKPDGASVIKMISESHVAIHTWPEHGYAAVDVFTCGDEGNAEDAYKVLTRASKVIPDIMFTRMKFDIYIGLVEKGIETEKNKEMIKNIREFGNPFGKLEKDKKIKELFCC